MDALYQKLYGNYRNRKFTDIWKTADSFIKDYSSNGIKTTIDAETSARTLFYLLYARYGNSTIASSDETQFKYKVFTLIFMYGPTWEKRLSMQDEIRKLTLKDIESGALAIYNHAFNPAVKPATDSEGEYIMDYINDQNTTRFKKSKTDAYMLWSQLLETDVTAYFLDRFKDLFLTVVSPELPLWYQTKLNNEEEIDE